jgi:hypothetical protein
VERHRIRALALCDSPEVRLIRRTAYLGERDEALLCKPSLLLTLSGFGEDHFPIESNAPFHRFLRSSTSFFFHSEALAGADHFLEAWNLGISGTQRLNRRAWGQKGGSGFRIFESNIWARVESAWAPCLLDRPGHFAPSLGTRAELGYAFD